MKTIRVKVKEDYLDRIARVSAEQVCSDAAVGDNWGDLTFETLLAVRGGNLYKVVCRRRNRILRELRDSWCDSLTFASRFAGGALNRKCTTVQTMQ